MTVVLVLLGGAVGAPTRYLTDVAVQRLHRGAFPWGTWTVNVVGSFVLGLVAAAAPTWAVTLLGTGFCGARLAEEGETTPAFANVAASLGVGLAAAALGWWLGGLV
jgi:CrcB protein